MQFCVDAFAAEFGGICYLFWQQRHRQADSVCYFWHGQNGLASPRHALLLIG
jgi:hypothetical protein